MFCAAASTNHRSLDSCYIFEGDLKTSTMASTTTRDANEAVVMQLDALTAGFTSATVYAFLAAGSVVHGQLVARIYVIDVNRAKSHT